jgi:hypothetical protein
MLSGAGIFIIEKYKNKIVAVLFGKKNKEYNEPGGVIDPGETPEETACRETREETSNLIKIDPTIIKKISYPIKLHKYMSYVIYIQNLSFRDYYHNNNLITNKCNKVKHHFWMETNSVIRIELKTLIKNALNNNNIMNDINEKTVMVRGRTLGIAKLLVDTNFFQNFPRPYNLHRKLTISSRLKCLIGTKTYTL